MLMILRVKGTSCQAIDDLGEGTLPRWCLNVWLVDLHFARGDTGVVMNLEVTTICAAMSSLFVSGLCCCCVASSYSVRAGKAHPRRLERSRLPLLLRPSIFTEPPSSFRPALRSASSLCFPVPVKY